MKTYTLDEVLSAPPLAWYKVVIPRLKRRLWDARYQVRRHWQWGVRGYADSDHWNLDERLCNWLGQNMLLLAKHTHGYPSEDWTYELWTATIQMHAERILAWPKAQADLNVDNYEEHMEIYARTQDSFRWVADNLASLWD